MLKTPPWELQNATPEQLRQACGLIDQRNAEAAEAEREAKRG